jgi:hypothetical protein
MRGIKLSNLQRDWPECDLELLQILVLAHRSSLVSVADHISSSMLKYLNFLPE